MDKPKCGFITEEIREKNKRKGFYITTPSGKQGILAHFDFKSKFKVGKYGVDVNILDKLSVEEIEKGLKENKIIILDEIGKMELFSRKFKIAVEKALDSENSLVATITLSPLPFVNKIKHRDDVKLFSLNRKNQDELLETLLSQLSK